MNEAYIYLGHNFLKTLNGCQCVFYLFACIYKKIHPLDIRKSNSILRRSYSLTTICI